MGQQTETDLQLGLALMEQVPDLDLSHRSLVSDDSKQQLGMEQKRTLTSMGRQELPAFTGSGAQITDVRRLKELTEDGTRNSS